MDHLLISSIEPSLVILSKKQRIGKHWYAMPNLPKKKNDVINKTNILNLSVYNLSYTSVDHITKIGLSRYGIH